jgi:hypothetical protein
MMQHDPPGKSTGQPGSWPGSADGRIAGTWWNVDQDADGLARLEIEAKGDLWAVRVWAKCDPEDCDWGAVPLHVMGDANGNAEPWYGLAHWDQGFASQSMVVRLEGPEMAVEFFTVFQDGSGRSNCRSVYRVCRAD